jgi:uncharacterized protein YhaN
MRIDRLDLRAYGGFTDKTLDLSGGAAGLHLIYGDNEAGKSTSLRAIVAWLFGIPAQTRDNYLHPHTQLRIGGQLRLQDGRTLDFMRRKGNKSTLLHADGVTALDDAALAPFLPEGMDEGLFTRLHGIDHERLESGGKALLSQSGDVGQALFSAAMGVASPRTLLADLQGRADELFKPRASTKQVNLAIAAFKTAKERTKALSLPVDEWKNLRTELAQVEARIEAIDAAIQHTSKEKSRLDRLNRVKGALGQRREVLQRLAGLEVVLLLPDDFEEKRSKASDRLQTATELKARAAARLAGVQQELAALNVRHELLDNETLIASLYRELGAVEKTVLDRPQQDGKRRLLRNDADSLLKAIRADLKVDVAASVLRPLLKKKKWLADLAKTYHQLSQRKASAAAALRDAEDQQQLLQQEWALQAPSDWDVEALQAAIAVARKAGHLEQRLAEAMQQATREQQACEQDLTRLGRFAGTLAALVQLALPVAETLDRFEQDLQACADALREAERQRHDFSTALAEAQHALTALLLTGDVPSLADLEGARHERDGVWQTLKQHYLAPQTAPDSELPRRYEQRLIAADYLADRLRLDADQVVKRADLEAKIHTLQARLVDIAATTHALQVQAATQQQAWAAVWQALGISAGTPREMKQWLVRAETLFTKVQAARHVQASVQALMQDSLRLKTALATHVPTLDIAPLSLEALLTLCEQRVAQEEAVRQRQRQLQQALEAVTVRLNRAHSDSRSIADEQAAWGAEWRQALEGLGLAADTHPEYALETFEQLVAFFGKFDDSEEMRKRIWGMDKVLEEFELKVFGFADSIGFARDGLDASTLAAQLHQGLTAARTAKVSLTKLQDAAKASTHDIQEATLTLQAAQAQLHDLRGLAQVDSDAALLTAGEASRHKRRLQQQFDALEQELSRNGDGLSITALEAEAALTDIDALDAALSKVSADLRDMQQQRDTLRDQRQTLQHTLNAKDGNANAAHASEEAEQHLTSIVTGVEHYLRLQMAALILKQRIEDYRKQHQTPVLLRAGELFAKLTLGAYARLRDEVDDDGKAVLKGVRVSNAEVAVEQMSEGTRAQLYLALRLATLEQQLHTGEPLPFVVDDILISFDDKRTRVGLEVLAEVAQRTQVLLFTHHRRVVDLAGALAAPAGVFTHEL